MLNIIKSDTILTLSTCNISDTCWEWHHKLLVTDTLTYEWNVMEQDSSFQKRVEIRKRERKGGKHIRKRNIYIYNIYI